VGDPDLMHGRAGTLIGLLALFGLDDAPVAAACRVLGDSLVAAVDTLELCGYSHGAGGVARALEELALATGDERYLNVADAAVRYERAWFSPMHGWPDLRGAADGSPLSYPAFWCHGAVGIGLARLASFARRADLLDLAEASAAIGFARNSVMAVVSGSDGPLDSSLCHGVAGAVELFLVAWEVTGAPEHLAAARRTGGLMMAHAQAAGGYGSGLIDRSETPGLFHGLAGVAAALLRLHDPAALPSPATFPWSARP
jgi:lantibiotic modifying enzyme